MADIMTTTKVRLNLDTVRYTSKPLNSEMGSLRNRLCDQLRITSVSMWELERAIQEGRSFTPGTMGGTKGDTWGSQQILCLDVDNKWTDTTTHVTHKLEGAERLTVREALDALARYNVHPVFYYPTFSAEYIDKEVTRFRIVILLKEALYIPDQMIDYTNRLIDILLAVKPNSTDKGTSEPARIFLGTCYNCYDNPDGAPVPISVLEKLPKGEAPKKAEKPAQQMPSAKYWQPGATFNREQAWALICRDWRNIIPSLTSPAKSRVNGETSWICPICGHGTNGDGLTFDPHDDSGFRLVCFGSGNDGQNGNLCFSGDIIALYSRVKGCSYEQALDALAAQEGLTLSESAEDVPSWEGPIEHLPDDATPEQIAEAQATESERRATIGTQAIDSFMAEVMGKGYEPLPTGISDIDNALGGGLIRQQLVLLGAAPGAGKTALAQWMFEEMAKKGTPCLFLNLEMSRTQILARSLSRIAAQITEGENKMSATDIMQGYKWTDAQQAAIVQAAQIYKRDIAPNMIYNPDEIKPDLDTIIRYIDYMAERATAAHLPAPLVVIDYLQIIRGKDREDDTSVIKRAVQLFKDHATKYKTVVFLIMAHNRASNASGNVTMESGRDTSALEYSADLQLALTYTACLTRMVDGEKIKGKNADELTPEERQRVTLKVIKSRFAQPGVMVDLFFNGTTMTYNQISGLRLNHTFQALYGTQTKRL